MCKNMISATEIQILARNQLFMLPGLTVLNAQVKSKTTQNLKSIFYCSTLKKSEI